MEIEGVQNGVVTVDIENIGGIENATVDFSPGVTILTGRNATNRTSFLQALMGALGSDAVTLKSDADEGSVKVSLEDETHTRELEREGGTIKVDGDPYLEDPTLADLFAFLIDSNDARRAMETNGDLRSIILEPIDTEEIQAEIDRLVRQREDIETQLEKIDQLKEKLPGLEDERNSLTAEVEETESTLDEIEAALEDAGGGVEKQQEKKSEVEKRLSKLHEKRSTLEDVRYELETEQEGLKTLRKERRELESEHDDLPEPSAGEHDRIETKLETLRARKRDLEGEINDLQSLIQFNENMLNGIDTGVPIPITNEKESKAVTDQLVEDDSFDCWTCGSSVEGDQIETTIDQLRDLVQERLSEVNEVEEEMDHLRKRGQQLQDHQARLEQLERRLSEVQTETENSENAINRLQNRRDELTDEIAELEAEVEELESETNNEEVLDLHKEANQLEYQLGELEKERERVQANIANIEDRLDEHDNLAVRLEDVREEIEESRTKIDRIEREAIEEFNDHMNTVLSLLDYQNLDRIWLERVETEVREGRQKVHRTEFEIHVIRTTSSGANYEDTLDHLSESEHDVAGLVFALAGYLVHEVHEVVPFMLLDSVEAIDAPRLAALVDYFADYACYLVVALLTEDAAALDDEYQRITSI